MSEKQAAVEVLPRTADSIEDFPEEVRQYVIEKDGKFHLGVKDAEQLKSALDKERQQVSALKKQVEDANEKIEKASQLEKQLRDLEHKLEATEKGVDNDEINDLVEKRVNQMRKDFETQRENLVKKLESAEKENDELRVRYRKDVIGREARLAAREAEAFPEAYEDIERRILEHFDFDEDDGSIVGRDKNGNIMVSKDGKSNMSIQEAVSSMTQTHGHYFPARRGTEAESRGRAGAMGAHSSQNDDQLKQLDPATRLGKLFEENMTSRAD